MRKILLIFFIPIAFVFADSVKLYNDSAFDLIAIIKSAQGEIIGQQSFAPGEQSTWDTDQITTQLSVNYNATGSYTPFMIVWQCSNGGLYSTCTGVSPGAIVTSNICSGPKYCKEKDQDDTNGSDCPPCQGGASQPMQPTQNGQSGLPQQNQSTDQGRNGSTESTDQNGSNQGPNQGSDDQNSLEKQEGTDLNNPDQNNSNPNSNGSSNTSFFKTCKKGCN